jgi:hypothetical protein
LRLPNLQAGPTVSAGIEVIAKLIQFVPMEVIVQVAMDLDAVLIPAVHSASFSGGGGGVSIPSRPLIKAYKR